MSRGEADSAKDNPVDVGKILGAHGVRGDLRVHPLSDFPERFAQDSLLWINGEQYKVESSNLLGRSLRLKLHGIDDRNSAEALSGSYLQVPEVAEIAQADTYYQHDLLGLRVEDEAGELLGMLSQVIETGANDVYAVQGERGELLLPAVDEVIKEVDLKGGRIVAHVLSGLEFRRPSPAKSRRRPERRGSSG